jgi:hypothetical protein
MVRPSNNAKTIMAIVALMMKIKVSSSSLMPIGLRKIFMFSLPFLDFHT